MAKPGHRTVRLDEGLVKEAERQAGVARRSVSGQLEYWIRLGRGVERNRNFSEDRLARFLAGAVPLDHLSLQEKVAAIHEVERAAQTAQSRAQAADQLREERERAGLPSYSVERRYPDQLVCRYPDGRVVVGHFEGTRFVEDQELERDLPQQRVERRRRAAS